MKIISVKIVAGTKYEDNWRSDMQEVSTDQGTFIDNAINSRFKEGHNWEQEIGNSVDAHINTDRYGHKWINFRKRLSENNGKEGLELQEGTKYSLTDLNDIFGFKYKKGAGIKKADSGDIVLFSNRDGHAGGYKDIWDGDSLDYEGQNTGPGEQELIYGNQDLYDIYDIPNMKDIYVFKDYIYKGKYLFNGKPYHKDGVWRFPLIRE